MEIFSQFERKIIGCNLCPRLREHCKKIAREKKPQYKDEPYWGKPVPSFGDLEASLWILGLAPAPHGANRTGRMFTGDSSGKWLFKALHKFGFSDKAQSTDQMDCLHLNQTYISAVVRCAPPQNKPSRAEILNCQQFLDEELLKLRNLRLIFCTGGIAFDAAQKLLLRKGLLNSKSKLPFRHGTLYSDSKVALLSSYHPSRQNTQTGRLTEQMWWSAFETAKRFLETKRPCLL